jgi:hypothetical protein
LDRQAAAARAQATAFQTMGSIMYSVVNGFVRAEEKKALEGEGEPPKEDPPETPEKEADTPPKAKRGRRKKT